MERAFGNETGVPAEVVAQSAGRVFSVARKRAPLSVRVIDALLWCALCVLLVIGILNQNSVRQYSSFSLRYSEPISGRAAYAARQYSASHDDGKTFWPTFWNESKVTIEGEFISVDADCIAFSGDASRVWPTVYIDGVAPGFLDIAGCAVSNALAWRLWGSTDVIGMNVQIDGEYRIVRGVFKSGYELALISFGVEDKSRDWNSVELTGGPDGSVRGDVVNYASAAGLGKPDSILLGGAASVAGAMTVLPLVILAVYLLALIWGYLRRHFPVARKPIFYVCIILFAVATPFILNALPAWVIPTRWSDFSFWVSLISQALDGLREFLYAAPRLRDVELMMHILKQSGITLLAVCCAISVCFRWHIRIADNVQF